MLEVSILRVVMCHALVVGLALCKLEGNLRNLEHACMYAHNFSHTCRHTHAHIHTHTAKGRLW